MKKLSASDRLNSEQTEEIIQTDWLQRLTLGNIGIDWRVCNAGKHSTGGRGTKLRVRFQHYISICKE